MPLSTVNSDQCVLIKLLHYYLSINVGERKSTVRRVESFDARYVERKMNEMIIIVSP